jgi:hypothetical protein
MNTRMIYVALVSGALGTAMGATYPALTAVAGQDLSHEQIFTSRNPPISTVDLQAAVQTGQGLGAQALAHGNAAMGLTGAKALSFTPTSQCPIKAINLSWELDDQGVCRMQWEYRTKQIVGTWVAADPQ